MTNYEKIKVMSVEEMKEYIGHRGICEIMCQEQYGKCTDGRSCDECLEEWLLQEAEE